MAERRAQKNRTRAALLETTRAMLARGEQASVAAAAEEAGISKATAYRYFSDAGVMAAEAALDIEVVPARDLLDGIDDVRERVHCVSHYFRTLSRRNETAFRMFLAKALESLVNAPEKSRPEIRGGRRIPAFVEALEPVRGAMDRDDFADLVVALSVSTGIEQHIAMKDVCGLDAAEADRIGRIVSDAILDRFGVD